MGDLPLRTPTYHRFGGPLPRQLPNRTHAHPRPPWISRDGDAAATPYGGSLHVSMGCPPAAGRLHTRYSPVRRSPSGYRYPMLPLDLHVLSLSLAFILSQDQTLHGNLLSSFLCSFARTSPGFRYLTPGTRTCCSSFSQYLKELPLHAPSPDTANRRERKRVQR